VRVIVMIVLVNVSDCFQVLALPGYSRKKAVK